MQVKFMLRYPTGVDRTGIQVNADGNISKPVVKRYIDSDGMFVLESDPVEFKDYAYLKDIPRDGLVLDIPFFEGQGTTAHDCSPNSNHGTISGAVWYKHGNIWTLEFDNDTDYVNIHESLSLNTIEDKHEFTITLWFYPLVSPNNNRLVLLKSGAYAIYYYPAFPDLIGFGWCITYPSYYAYVVRPITIGTWQFLSFSYKRLSSTSLKFRISRDLNKIEATWYDASKSVDDIRPGYPLILGSGTWSAFPCRIAFLKIYNRYLDWDEVKEIYELEKQILGV